MHGAQGRLLLKSIVIKKVELVMELQFRNSISVRGQEMLGITILSPPRISPYKII